MLQEIQPQEDNYYYYAYTLSPFHVQGYYCAKERMKFVKAKLPLQLKKTKITGNEKLFLPHWRFGTQRNNVEEGRSRGK